MSHAIHPIRQATRKLVREFHMLDGRAQCCGIPLSECHLITELDLLGEATASDLCERMVLEKSTMSRLVNKLVDKGLICAACCEDDRRARILCLTKEGKAQARRLNRHASDQLDATLSYLSAEDENAVLEGLDRYADALRSARLARAYTVRPIQPADDPAVAAILRQVMTEFGLVGEGFPINDPEIDAMHEAYSDPDSAFFVVAKDGQILGCGGFGPLGGVKRVCELQKMYFLPQLRGTGMGALLLGQILQAARDAGYERCYLETMHNMDRARGLYSKHGFEMLDRPLGSTGHGGCNKFMISNL